MKISRVISSIALAVSVVFLSGCATSAGYKKMMDSWIGASESNLISRWGPPQNVYSLSDGGKILTYDRRRNFQMGGYPTTTPVTTYNSGSVYGDVNATYNGTSTTYVQSRTPVQNIEMVCITRFTVRYGRVQSAAWEGDDCKAREE